MDKVKPLLITLPLTSTELQNCLKTTPICRLGVKNLTQLMEIQLNTSYKLFTQLSSAFSWPIFLMGNFKCLASRHN